MESSQPFYSLSTDEKLIKFQKQRNLIKQMRNENPAPVDTMGCSSLAEKDKSPSIQRFHTLCSLVLSAQTKDEITSKAMKKLQQEGLEIKNVITWSIEKIEKLIYPVGFYKRKAKYLKDIALILRRDYNDDIPKTIKELEALPGIGPKMSHLIMHHAWDEIQGIGVDVHVHRISRDRLQWVNQTKNPDQTRKELEKWLPKENWKEINEILVGFGQTICKSRPLCNKCKLPEENLCPYYERNKQQQQPENSQEVKIHRRVKRRKLSSE